MQIGFCVENWAFPTCTKIYNYLYIILKIKQSCWGKDAGAQEINEEFKGMPTNKINAQLIEDQEQGTK